MEVFREGEEAVGLPDMFFKGKGRPLDVSGVRRERRPVPPVRRDR
jgi:hypothetical protein